MTMTDQQRPDLLPCPFCGGDSHIGYLWSRTEGFKEYHVNCAKCSSRKEGFTTKESATLAWNTRAPQTEAAQGDDRRFAEQKVLAVRGSYDAPGFDACVDAELSAISYPAQTSGNEWQPIETCPSDGSPVWIHREGLGVKAAQADGQWWRNFNNETQYPVTHWMPNSEPKPPSAYAQGHRAGGEK